MLWLFFVNIRCFGCCRWRFRSYSGSLLQTPKSNQNAGPRRSALAVARVPSLRGSSGGIAYGLLRCTSSRCVRLRRTVAALPPPDQSRNEACRRGRWIKIKSRRADTRTNGGRGCCGSSLLAMIVLQARCGFFGGVTLECHHFRNANQKEFISAHIVRAGVGDDSLVCGDGRGGCDIADV